MEAAERSESYYSVLGVSHDSSMDEIRRAYRKLAMQWHPDKWARKNPCLLGEANRRFQKIQEAYSVLSDSHKRAMYNAGLYDPYEEDDEGFCDFMQEMLNLMAQVKDEAQACSLEELQKMVSDLAGSFDSTEWYSNPPPMSSSGFSSTRLNWSRSPTAERPGMQVPDLGMFGMSGYCR